MAQAPTQTFVVVDDHDPVREETCRALKNRYPEARLFVARQASEVDTLVQKAKPDLVITDLSMPEWVGEPAQVEVGLNLLRSLLPKYPKLHFVVQSAHVKALVQLKASIDQHQAGFTIADKSLSSDQMLTKVDWALRGLLYTPPDMRLGLDIKPEWVKMLRLAFIDGLTDQVIAQRMRLPDYTVRHYWTRIQNAFSIYPNTGDGDTMRIQTKHKARQLGLLD